MGASRKSLKILKNYLRRSSFLTKLINRCECFKAKLRTNRFSSRYELPHRIFLNTPKNPYWVIHCFVMIVMRCAIWYHLYNFKKVKDTHGRVLILVTLQALACNFTKINNPPWVFFTFIKLYKWYQIAQRITIVSYFCKTSS